MSDVDERGGDWVDEALEALSAFIGKRVAGVAVSPGAVELIFEDCSVLSISESSGALLGVDRLREDECRCLRKCLEAHGIAREETQECMDECLGQAEA